MTQAVPTEGFTAPPAGNPPNGNTINIPPPPQVNATAPGAAPAAAAPAPAGLDAAIAAKNRIVGGLKSVTGDDNKIAYLQSQGIAWKENDDGEIVADFTGSQIESDIENKRYDLNETDAILAEYQTGMPKASENRARAPFKVDSIIPGSLIFGGDSSLANSARKPLF